MVRLISPTGVTVNVGDDKADQLRAVGYKAEGEKKAPAKKSASSSNSKK